MSPEPAFVWTSAVGSPPEAPIPSLAWDSSFRPRLKLCLPSGTRAMSRRGRVKPGSAMRVVCAFEACVFATPDATPVGASLETCSLLLLLVPESPPVARARPAAARRSAPAAARARRSFRKWFPPLISDRPLLGRKLKHEKSRNVYAPIGSSPHDLEDMSPQ